MNDKYLVTYQLHHCYSKHTPDSLRTERHRAHVEKPHSSDAVIFLTIIPRPHAIISNALGYILLIVDSSDPNLF